MDLTMNKESVRIQRELAVAGKSRGAHYRELVIGQKGFWSLLKYELILLLCCDTPGALGLWLRSKLYPRLLKRCGRGVVFGARVTLRHPGKIEIGDNVVIDDNCLLDAKGRDNEGIRLGNDVFLGRNSILSCKNGNIALGDNVNIGFNCEVFSGSQVTIGRDTLVAAYCYFIGGDHDSDEINRTILQQGSSSFGIDVGANCWFGAGVKVLDHVAIGAHCIVGAGAVVTKDLPAYAVAVGIPARVVEDRRESAKGAEETM
jgi:acetyltransferase-like isoleucine patch superfamily enzyme